MFDIGVTKLAIIGGIALVVIGPERLPSVARTLGALIGRAQRYVAEVKSEVNRSMELDELRKVKETVESAAQEVSSSIQTGVNDFEKSWSEATSTVSTTEDGNALVGYAPPPQYRHPNKKWRIKRGAMPQWYKAQAGVRTKAQSGAARVARFRPKRPLP